MAAFVYFENLHMAYAARGSFSQIESGSEWKGVSEYYDVCSPLLCAALG